MEFKEIKLVAGPNGLPIGIGLSSAEVRTDVHTAQQDHHITKHQETVHTIEVKNASRRKLVFWIESTLPDERVKYRDHNPTPRAWSELKPVQGVLTTRDQPDWKPLKSFMEHPATCPAGNSHFTDIDIRVETGLEGENVNVLETEEAFVYDFKCTC